MAIPITYNLRSVRQRWNSSIVAILGIAGTVGVFVAMLSLAHGFKATLVASGTPDNALILRAGANAGFACFVSTLYFSSCFLRSGRYLDVLLKSIRSGHRKDS